ncbi:MAG TPA: hypothetical protein VFL70_11000 [Bacteroidia bacterium]|nr:hypothetical protein [Bacteroidia bacterium]
MPFSSGQKTFALIFIVSFLLLMILAYWKDANISKVYYKNVWKILIGVLAILALIVWLIKITR